MTVEELGVTVVAAREQLLREWERAARAEPELCAEPCIHSDLLPRLFTAIASAALLRPQSRRARLDVIWQGARLGEQCRARNFTPTLVVLEHQLIRQAISHYLARLAPGSRELRDALARVEVALLHCLRAALHGYNRPEREAEGQWPAVVEGLAWTWPPPAAA